MTKSPFCDMQWNNRERHWSEQKKDTGEIQLLEEHPKDVIIQKMMGYVLEYFALVRVKICLLLGQETLPKTLANMIIGQL